MRSLRAGRQPMSLLSSVHRRLRSLAAIGLAAFLALDTSAALAAVALYTMEKQKNGAWRISGCRIGASTIQAAQWIGKWNEWRNEWGPQLRPSMSPFRAICSTASSKRLV